MFGSVHIVCACVRLGCNLSDGDGSNSLKIVDMYRLCLEWEQEGQRVNETESQPASHIRNIYRISLAANRCDTIC